MHSATGHIIYSSPVIFKMCINVTVQTDLSYDWKASLKIEPESHTKTHWLSHTLNNGTYNIYKSKKHLPALAEGVMSKNIRVIKGQNPHKVIIDQGTQEKEGY